jgi:hypothetical protein
MLQIAGVNLQEFQAHSYRSASTSKALDRGVSIDNILERGTWSQASTFTKFYSRQVDRGLVFSDTVLTLK